MKIFYRKALTVLVLVIAVMTSSMTVNAAEENPLTTGKISPFFLGGYTRLDDIVADNAKYGIEDPQHYKLFYEENLINSFVNEMNTYRAANGYPLFTQTNAYQTEANAIAQSLNVKGFYRNAVYPSINNRSMSLYITLIDDLDGKGSLISGMVNDGLIVGKSDEAVWPFLYVTQGSVQVAWGVHDKIAVIIVY